MINYTFVYDLSKKKSTVFKPERKESDYKEPVEMFIGSVLKDPTSNKRQHLRFFDTDEIGFCVLNGETALGVITTKLANEHQRRIVIEFINTVNARLAGNNKPKTSREARTFLKSTIAEYTKKLNLAKMFPERVGSVSKQLELDVASWFMMEAEAAKHVINCKKERDSLKILGLLPNTWGFLGGVILVLLLLFLWLYIHFF